MRKITLSLFFLAAVSIFSLSYANQNVTQSNISEVYKDYAANVKADDFAPDQLQAHYLKHKDEFGDITQEQYLENARNLLNAPPSSDVLEKTRSNGDILHYRVSTSEFAVMSRDGRIRTYFKAGYKYWMRQ